MSDTPETDAQGFGDGRHPWVATDFACKLERERDDLQKAVNNLCNHLGVNPANTTLLAVEILKIIRERDEAREAFVIATDQMVVAQGKVREANKERDEALIDRTNGDIATMTINHYERILRERDEVRGLLASEKITRDHIIKRGVEVQKERDEAIAARKASAADWLLQVENADRRVSEAKKMAARAVQDAAALADKLSGLELRSTEELARLEQERNEWKNKAYSHATDYTLMEAKCFRLEQQLKEYDKLKS